VRPEGANTDVHRAAAGRDLERPLAYGVLKRKLQREKVVTTACSVTTTIVIAAGSDSADGNDAEGDQY